MNKKKRLILIIILAFLSVVIIAFMVFKNHKKSVKKQIEKKIVNQKEEESLEYDFFYQSANGNYLIPIKKKVSKHTDMKEQIKEVVLKLFEGVDASDKRYINLFSKRIKLNNIFIVNKEIVVLDLNREIYSELLGSSIDEILTIYSIVDTICFNFPYIKGVQIIVDGRQLETLAGHIDVSRPIRMDSKWIRPI